MSVLRRHETVSGLIACSGLLSNPGIAHSSSSIIDLFDSRLRSGL